MARRKRLSALLLVLVFLLLMAFTCPLTTWLYGQTETGTLDVTINYSDGFYTQTFDYSRYARNIRHFVLILPQSEVGDGSPTRIFSGLEPQEEGFTLSEDSQEYAWALDYVYEAPRGWLVVDLGPGTYAVAAAFIARRPPADANEEIDWNGTFGGGASTDLQTVVIEPGETSVVVLEMTDDNGWACPWLYVFDGEDFERRTEILRDLRGPENEQTETTALGPITAVDGFITIRIAEEKEEITYLDSLALLIDGETIYAEAQPIVLTDDGDYLTLSQGESVELRFPVPASFADGDGVSVVANGYYVPLEPTG
jgi:hypothetical protein